MYELSALDDLARDEQFADAVCTAAHELLTSGAVDTPKEIWPLLQYGPANAGTALRLTKLQLWADLGAIDDRLLSDLSALTARVQAAYVG